MTAAASDIGRTLVLVSLGSTLLFVQVLLQKYAIAAANAPTCVRALLEDSNSRKVLENWYYAAQYYNGGPSAEQYRDYIYDHVLHPAARISGIFPPVEITRSGNAISGFTAGQSFSADASGNWTDKNCATHANGASSVHVSGSFPSATPTPTPTPTVTPTPTATPSPTPAVTKLGNISTRLSVQAGDNVLIAGTIVVGQTSQTMLLRAIGPSLPVSGSLADPTLELHDGNGALLEANDNWVDSPNKQAIIDTTIPPSNNLESAILRALAPGNYTAIVRGVNDTTGVALVKVYALN